MREIRGDMFSYLDRMKFKLFITTNGFIKNDGYAVMGRGNAARAVTVFKEEKNLNLPDLLGKSLKTRGNNVVQLTSQLYTFPVKDHWVDRARRTIIKRSVKQLEEIIERDKKLKNEFIYVVPRPGCGNGMLRWIEDVKPLMQHLPDNVWVICDWTDPNWKPKEKKEHHVHHSKRHSHRRQKSVIQTQLGKRKSHSR